MTDFIIIDDFLEKAYHGHLLHELDSFNFPWYYQHNISYADNHQANKDSLGNFGFGFWIKSDDWTDSGMTKFLMPFCYRIAETISATSILRVRIDMTMFNPLNHMHQPHIDLDIPHYASVYYVNDSDGDTVIYNEKYNGNQLKEMESLTVKERITPKANRLLVFDGRYYHTGHSPSRHKNRIIINSNYGIA